MNLISNHLVKLKSDNDEFILQFSEWERFKDSSGLQCKLLFRNSYFEVRNYPFFIDLESFTNFLPSIKKIYKTLKGEVELGYRYENDKINIKAQSNGHIELYCSISTVMQNPQDVSISFEVDQTYLVDFIDSWMHVHQSLGF